MIEPQDPKREFDWNRSLLSILGHTRKHDNKASKRQNA
jgi:hypothetical protein